MNQVSIVNDFRELAHLAHVAMTRPWLPIPSPVRRLFTSFPLQTFPPSSLPSSCPNPTEQVPRLFIYANNSLDVNIPSWDAQCLKWQVIPLVSLAC